MIQAVSLANSQISYKSNNSRNKTTQKAIDLDTAIVNAGGLSASVGLVTTAITKVYTSKWLTAIGMGTAATLLALVFMLPRFIEKKYLSE